MKLDFQIRGSAGDAYNVLAEKVGTEVRMSCTCAAGQNGMHCKHRFMLLNGVVDHLISDNIADVTTLKSWLPGSKVEAALDDLSKAEAAVKAAQSALARSKKYVARAMSGQV